MRAAVAVIQAWGAALIAAFQFLTRLPMPIALHYDDALFRRSVVFYPVVGLVLGWLLVGAGKLLMLVVPALPAASLLLSVWIALTGALHLDGLMDTADGILSHRSRERMLEIMKDSRVGAMGVIACVVVLLLKWSLLLELMTKLLDADALLLLPLVTIWSRWFMVAAISRWPYARAEQGGGMGGMFRGVGWKVLLLQTVVAIAASWLTVSVSSAAEYGLATVTIFGMVALVAGWLIARYISGKLGGLTGDTYGALNELLETLLLLVILWLLSR
ncbi:adenosylcobinamide-GDP ribazoletransferase [Paenibacillus allorhizosphaerae]|uniref:Adenosylcobinamide-GDP ribazoletransferase n=1 Tax=Paenibacillus allorhizosphaerae TaxID=2849866 RepID=A0ABN7TKR0_9BACL|nr:adenosylcobinamide-GDP ribazoletransferase [Paenibacillus allorhizosphaerae]CAG7633228.1 Adenosylcobinamide-GDP ribazoletransferase [Paenibacillus allorhizosphaerae]